MFKTARNLFIAAGVAFAGMTGMAAAAGGEVHIPEQEWSFDGPFGTFDRAALQRGFQVYSEVCAACHGMQYLHYRNLGEAGGPEFTEAQVKAIAAAVDVSDIDDEGETIDRPGLPKDKFVSPFANTRAAAAAHGVAPPDLSLMAKARVGGPDYIFALLNGYEDGPEDFEGANYNKYFPGHNIAMAQPLFDDQVEYQDGTPATQEQMARDVSQFLMWAAEPKLEARRSLGIRVMLYLIILAGLMYFVKRKVWADAH